MEIPIYQVDAFTEKQFQGNPAAVCPLDKWLDDDILKKIALENNLPETAFLLKKEGCYELRWFTPRTEVDLCGHATLAAGYVILNYLEKEREKVIFKTRSGELELFRDGRLLSMIFPSRPGVPCTPPEDLLKALQVKPQDVLHSRDYLVVYNNEEEIRALNPDMELLKRVDCLGVIVTAPGTKGVDFVSRFFAPAIGVPEDPVTGSAHCTLVPYWAARLDQKKFTARQLSARGGNLICEDFNDRVKISGRAVTYLKGTIII